MFSDKMYWWSYRLQQKMEHKYPQDLKLKHIVVCMEVIKEMTEVLDCMPWKLSREMDAKPREELLEEMVDVFNFFMRLLYVHRVTSEEFEQAWEKKRKKVEERLGHVEI